MVRRQLLLFFSLLLCHMGVRAVPAYPVKKWIAMADGSRRCVALHGDEFSHYYLTADGLTLCEQTDGSYATISQTELSLLRCEGNALRTAVDNRRAAKAKHRAPLTGEKKGLVILVNFTDNAFTVENPQKAFYDYFNKAGYNDYGMTGSVSDYFLQQSYGQFNLKFDVAGPYTLPHNMVYYGGPSGSYHDARPQEMIGDAVQLADVDVDFCQYDWDADGEVDQVFVIYAGYGENYGAPANTIWPHESSISYQGLVLDGMNIGTYATSCELFGNKGTDLDGIGTACHEFSHCLGIMDHYDMNGKNFGMGTWDVMCRGTYNNDGRTPAAYTAYERWVNGWLEPVEVNSGTRITGMKALTDAPEAYILYNEGNRNEYYLLENRQQKGFDASLGGHGLLVVHVDYDKDSWKGNTINSGDIQRMTIIAADEEYEYASTSSLAGDPFPGTTGKMALQDFTSPKAIVNCPNADGSLLMRKGIESIKEDDEGKLSMLLCANPLVSPTMAATDVTSTSFRLSWDKVQDAESYEIYLDEVAKKADVKDAMILGEDFNNCYSKSAGFTDISAKDMSKYLPGFSGSRLFTTPDYLRIGTATTAGYLYSPFLEALSTGDLTIVMKVKPYKAGTTVKGVVKITTNTEATQQSFDLSFNQESTFVFHSYTQFNETFRVDIIPSGAMYISGLYLYDGNFTDEELGITSSNKAPQRAHVKTITTENNYYEFTGLNPNSVYSVKLRSLAPDRTSEWSEMYTISNPTSIQIVQGELLQADNAWYDLSGCRILTPARGLYIHNGKKVLVK